LRSIARIARTSAGVAALHRAFRKELRIEALTDLPEEMRLGVPMSNRAIAGRPPRRGEDQRLPHPHRASWSKTAADYVAEYEARRLTPEAVLKRVLEQARALEERTPTMAVLCEIAEDDAREAADGAGDRYRIGTAKGPLDGVCVIVKEQMNVRGLVTRAGTNWVKGPPAEGDATIVARLRAAGAVIVGNSPMTEYGMTPLGFNPFRKMPRNPHAPGHTAGGSSTGSGVAVATGLVPIALGADGGGSIRIPSALNGVFGIKPTWGRVSRAGDPSGGTVAHLGPLAASTLDLAQVLEIIAGPDAADEETAAAPAHVRGTLVSALGRGVRGLRIGVPESEWSDAAPAVERAGREALVALEREGAILVAVDEPMLAHAPAIGYLSISSEARALLRGVWADHGDELTADLQVSLCALEGLSAIEYVETQRLREGLRRRTARIFRDVDLLALPSVVDTAPAVTDAQFNSGFLDAHALSKLCRFAFLGNLTGLPAASMPVGVDGSSLPIGFQLMGDAWDEATVLAASAHLERIGLASCPRPKVAVDLG
jgi:aspartyl-tRNA(Asn)/glutamyl-tRNA(Gln) amidotransferase subunit A